MKLALGSFTNILVCIINLLKPNSHLRTRVRLEEEDKAESSNLTWPMMMHQVSGGERRGFPAYK